MVFTGVEHVGQHVHQQLHVGHTAYAQSNKQLKSCSHSGGRLADGSCRFRWQLTSTPQLGHQM